jgi:hypothetical protein
MILSIPYQRFESSRVQVQTFIPCKYNRTMALLSYTDPAIDFKDITLITPPMRVMHYHAKTSMLRMDVSEHIVFQLKLYTFYEYLTNLLFINQYDFFNETHLSYEMIRSCFYTILTKSVLSLYIHPETIVTYGQEGIPISHIQPGDMIRCVIRIQGISQIMGKDGMRLRLHHYIPSIWRV